MQPQKGHTVNNLLTLTAVIETAAGLALVALPSVPVRLLFGSSLDTSTSLTVGRWAGAALLAMGVVCWLARHDGQSRAATGLVAAILLYNLAIVVLFAYAGLGSGLVGVALWPAVVLHAAMAAWCIACLRSKRVTARGQ
jgi:hypothetical protein